MPVSQEDIANMAIGVLDEAPIESLDDDSKAARLVKLHFETTREAELTKRNWYFAITTAELTGTDTGSESGTLNWSFNLPDDFLRLLPPTHNGEPDGIPIAFEQRDGKIFTDQDSPRIFRYIANLSEPNDWDALFTEVFVAALAIKLAMPLTHKISMVEIAQRVYDRALAEAVRANAIQRSQQMFRQSWAQARGDDRFWRA